MSPDLQALSRLQGIEERILELKREIASLPKQIAEIEKQLESHQRKYEAEKALLTAAQKERKQRDLDIQTAEQKISKLRDQMLQAKNNEQYRAFQHEIEYAQNEIRKAEDRIIELMEESEAHEKNVKRAEAELTTERKQVDAQKADATQRTAADQKELTQLVNERKQLMAGFTPQLTRTYERIRKKYPAGPLLAEAVEGKCRACHMQLRPQYWQDLKQGEQLLSCETCGRLLFYNPPVRVEM